MLYIRKLFTQDLRDGKQIAFPKEPSNLFFNFDYSNEEEDRKITFTFKASFAQFQQYDGKVISTRLYAAGSESRMDGEVKAFIRDQLNAQVDDIIIFKNKGTKYTEYEFMFVPQSNTKYYTLLLQLTNRDNHTVYCIEDNIEDDNLQVKKAEQIIYFGAPGTGKSFKVEHREGETEDDRIRTTFHPDTDYSSFVGCYKPIEVGEGEDKRITYKFEGQCFAKAYVEAWKRLVARKEGQNINYSLIIEEINRGNCAQIFGDIFQLLDRDSDGFSQYGIQPDADLAKYLCEEFEPVKEQLQGIGYGNIAIGKEMKLPPNLSIIATMNTSDQSLFPIDSAFKRRWDWEYIPIQYSPIDKETEQPIANKININGTIYDWGSFIKEVNERIYKLTKSEDKELGYFFVRPDDGINITMQRFVSKVIFYLWSDIYKDYAGRDNSIFKFSEDEDEKNKIDHSFNSFFNEKEINTNMVKKFIEQFVKSENIDGLQNNDELKLTINGQEINVKLSGTNGGKSVAEALQLLSEEQIEKLFNSDYNQSPILNGRCKVIDDHKLPETDPNDPAISDYAGYKSMQWQIGSYNYYVMTYVTSKRREYFEKFSEILGEDILKIEEQ